MATLAQLKAVVAAMHQKSVDDLSQNGQDMFLDAVNSVRHSGELLHDFEASRSRGQLVVDGVNGGSLADVTFAPPNSQWAGIKTITGISIYTTNGYDYPLSFARKEVAEAQEKQMNDLDFQFAFNQRYPSDASYLALRTGTAVVQVGQNLFVYPTATNLFGGASPFTLNIEAFCFLADYTAATLADDTYTDFLLQHGFNWLKWAVVHELNWLYSTFVPRQEGNVGSVEKKRDEEWEKLVLWDSYLIDPHMTTLT